MLIENPEALRLWLEDYLPPLCDADPEVLSRYCLALIRKDRKDEDLKSSMIEALDVFLKDNTDTFVDVFLSVVKSQSYIPKGAKSDAKPESPENAQLLSLESISPEYSVEAKTPISAAVIPNSVNPPSPPPLPTMPPPDNTMPHPPPESSPPPLSPMKKEEVGAALTKSRKDVDRDDRRRRKSTSRSRDRVRRSRSRGHSSRNRYDDRRRRSPHSKRYRRTRSRSRSPRRSRSPARRSRSRDRRSRSLKSTSPKRATRHRSRSRSPFTKTTLPNSPSKSPAKADVNESPSKEAAFSDKEISLGSAHQRLGAKKNSTKSRCRDYDEQGFCMRGDQCPFDHGSDPVVLEGAALEFPPPISTAPPQTTTSYTAPPPAPIGGQEIGGRPLMPHPPPSRGGHLGEYTPNNPGIWSGDPAPNVPMFFGSGRGRGMSGSGPRYTTPHSVPPPDIGRELISVPVDSNSRSKGGIRAPLQRPGQVHSQVSYSLQNLKYGDNCTLELKKIPHGMNTIALLNQHFIKFGNLTNIQVHHCGDPEAALVTFCNSSEASAAYRSTEAVLNNRFIKIFWHHPHKTGPLPVNQRNIHDRIGNRNPNKSLNNNKQPEDMTEKIVLTKGSLLKTVYNATAVQTQSSEISTAVPDSTQQSNPTPDEMKKLEIEAICKQQELLKAEIVAHNTKEKKKAETIKLKMEVELRTRQLLQKQMVQVKVLVNKLETNRGNMKEGEIKAMVGTIKSLQVAVDNTKARLCSKPVPAPVLPSSAKLKFELDKEILDTELELYNVQSEGGDISRLRARLQLLKVQVGYLKAKSQYPTATLAYNTLPYPVRGRGIIRGAARRSRGRGRGNMVNVVDRRTSTIHVSGFEKEDKDDVIQHFSCLGSITNYTWDRHTPSISVQFATRREAEKIMVEGRNLQDRLLTLTWTHPNSLEEAIVPGEPTLNSVPEEQRAHSTTTSTHDETEEITEEIIEVEETVEPDDELLIYEEDDESEGRSWRR